MCESVRGCARVCRGVRECVHWCARVCAGVGGSAWICMGVGDIFSEFLLENRVPISADFNTYPKRILLNNIAKCLESNTFSRLFSKGKPEPSKKVRSWPSKLEMSNDTALPSFNILFCKIEYFFLIRLYYTLYTSRVY